MGIATPRVLVATSFAYPHTGGASTHIDALIRELKIKDEFACVRQGGDLFPSRSRRVLMRAAAMTQDRYQWHVARWLIEQLTASLRDALSMDSSISLIHAHDHRACLAARAAAGALGNRHVAIVQTVHGPWLYEVQQYGHSRPGSGSERFIRRHEAASFAAADQIITVDSGQRGIALEFGAEAERISVIPNAVDLEEVDRLAALEVDGAYRRHVTGGRAFLIVPRRLVPKTGVRFAVEAMGRIPAAQRPRLLIAGDGPLMAEIQELAGQIGVANDVVFLGPVPREKLLAIMARAAGVIVPSIPAAGVIEATSLSAIEAMAMRVPIIASGIGGLAEIIEHGSTGLLTPPGDADAIAAAIGEAMKPNVAARLKNNARLVVEQRLSTKPWFAAIRAVYEKAMRGTAR